MRRIVTTSVLAATVAIGAVAAQAPPPAAPAAPAQAAAPAQGRQGRAGDTPAPARKSGEGQGPYRKLVIRSVTLIDGTGGPPLSPMDIVIEGNRITDVRQGGWPGLPLEPNREPRDADFEIDGKGMYVMPGFVDMHVHGVDHRQGARPRLRLQAVAGARRHHGARRVAVVQRRSPSPRRTARPRTRSPRRASSTTRRSASGWPGGRVQSPEKARE